MTELSLTKHEQKQYIKTFILLLRAFNLYYLYIISFIWVYPFVLFIGMSVI